MYYLPSFIEEIIIEFDISHQCEPSLRRRGSLPYELGRKPSTNNESGRIFTIPPDCSGKLNLCLRRGSAPSNLFRSANTTITSGLVLTRDRGKFSVIKSHFFHYKDYLYSHLIV